MYSIKELSKEVLPEISRNNVKQTVYTTYEWVCFLEKNQNGKIIVLQLNNEDDKPVGYFVGMIIKKFGIRILGSPFEQWLTQDMGFIKLEGFDLIGALNSVKIYGFNKLKCHFIQIIDKDVDINFANKNKMIFSIRKDLYLDISKDKDEIFSSFDKKARNKIRSFERNGNKIEIVNPSHNFADVFYSQLIDVFAKQNLKPNYSKSKIYDLMDAFKNNSKNILCLQAISNTNEIIATGIYIGYNQWCYSLVTASSQNGLKYKPNEYLRWYGINYWKQQGCTNFDFCGYREYKLKFKPIIIETPVIIFTKYKILLKLKKIAASIIKLWRKLKGKK